MTSSLTPAESVKREFAALLEATPGRIGAVYRLTQRGMTPPQIAAELNVSSAGFVSNNRTIARAMLEGHLPTGPSMARQVVSGVHKVTGRAALTPDAKQFLDELLEALDGVVKGEPKWTVGRTRTPSQATTVGTRGSLRAQVEEQLRQRTRELVATIKSELDLECDDYHRVAAGASPLDALQRLVQLGTTTRTTRALHDAGHPELSLEARLLEWTDLPLAADLLDSARGRLGYWSGT